YVMRWHVGAPSALIAYGAIFSHDCTRGGQWAKCAPRSWKTTRAGPSGSVQAREHEDRELPAGLLLILDKNRHLGGLAVEQALALLPRGHGGLDPKVLAAHFDRRLRVRDEVVVPRGMLGGSGERGDHDEAIAIGWCTPRASSASDHFWRRSSSRAARAYGRAAGSPSLDSRGIHSSRVD